MSRNLSTYARINGSWASLGLVFVCVFGFGLVFEPSRAQGAIVRLDAQASGAGTGSSHNVTIDATGANSAIFVSAGDASDNTGATVTSCDFNGSALTRIGGSGTRNTKEIWYIVGVTGSHTLTCNWAGGNYTEFEAVSYSGVDQSTPWASGTSASANTTTNLVLTATNSVANAWGFASVDSDNQMPVASTNSYRPVASSNQFNTVWDSNGALGTGSQSMTFDNSGFTGGGGTAGYSIFINPATTPPPQSGIASSTTHSNLALLSQGQLNGHDYYLSSGAHKNWVIQVGKGYTGSTTSMFISARFTTIRDDGQFIVGLIKGYTDSAYTVGTTTCGFDTMDLVQQAYTDDVPIQLGYNASFAVGYIPCVFRPDYYYEVDLSFDDSHGGGTGSYISDYLIVNGALSNLHPSWDISSTTSGSITQNLVIPYFAIVANGFVIYDSQIQASFISACGGGLSFDLFTVTCFQFLAWPSADDWTNVYENYVTQILSKAPWGYATRAISLLKGDIDADEVDLTDALSADLPSLNVDVKNTGLPITAGLSSVNLTPWYRLMGSSSILGTATNYQGNTFRDVTESGWNFLVAFLFGVAILSKVLGLDLPSGVETQIINSRKVPRKA